MIFVIYPVFSSSNRNTGLLLHTTSYQKRKSYEIIARFNHGMVIQVYMAESTQTMPWPLLYIFTTAGTGGPSRPTRVLQHWNWELRAFLFLWLVGGGGWGGWNKAVRISLEASTGYVPCSWKKPVSSRRKCSPHSERRGIGALRGCWDPWFQSLTLAVVC